MVETRQYARGPEIAPQERATVDVAALPDDLDLLEHALAGSAGQAPAVTSPNVLLITVDALRADHLGICGNDWIVTPSIDLLGRYSSVSCNTYSQQPQTNPALASLLTSTYPAVHGVRMHMVDRLADSFDTLAKALRRQGLRTAAVLPWTSLEPAFSGFHQGFDTYEAFVVNEPPMLQNPATAALAGIYRRVTDQLALGSAVEAVLGLRRGTEAEIDGRADVTTNATVNWLANFGSSQFFLWVHYFDPHYPFTPPEPWDQLYDEGYTGRYDGSMGFVYEMRAGIFEPEPRDAQYLRALYASEVSFADHHIGKMLTYMAQIGLLDNTIIVLTADHGQGLGERGGWWPNGEYWLHGDDLYNIGIQVPLIVYDPRGSRRHQTLTAPLQHIDVMPTILDLLGFAIPRQAQGRSIVPLIAGTEDGASRFAVSTLGDDAQTAIITADGWKLIAARKGDDRELYYLPRDPQERHELSASFPALALTLARQLESWVQATNTALATTSGEQGGSG
jgi:arylsulfatase A-like enzyme